MTKTVTEAANFIIYKRPGAESSSIRIVLFSYMTETADVTRVSSRGQVVIPQSVRDAVHLREGEILAIYGEGDTIVLKRIATPGIDEMKEILSAGERFAKRRKLTRRDVTRAVRETRTSG